MMTLCMKRCCILRFMLLGAISKMRPQSWHRELTEALLQIQVFGFDASAKKNPMGRVTMFPHAVQPVSPPNQLYINGVITSSKMAHYK